MADDTQTNGLLTAETYCYDGLNIGALTGRKVSAIRIDEQRVTFDTDNGAMTWEAEGDCCSESYFYSFEGVARLIGNTVTEVHEIDLQPGDVGYHADTDASYGECPCGGAHDVLQVYGIRFTTEDPRWGKVSSVLSFRNDSNGYYGGMLSSTSGISTGMPLTADWVTDDLGR